MTLDDEALRRFPAWSDGMRKRWVAAKLAANAIDATVYSKLAAKQPPPQQFFPRSMREATQ